MSNPMFMRQWLLVVGGLKGGSYVMFCLAHFAYYFLRCRAYLLQVYAYVPGWQFSGQPVLGRCPSASVPDHYSPVPYTAHSTLPTLHCT